MSIAPEPELGSIWVQIQVSRRSLLRDAAPRVGEQIEERMSRAALYRDLPRGKKRRGWKKEFLESLTEAAKNIGEVSDEEISQTVRAYRKERRAPEITVVAER